MYVVILADTVVSKTFKMEQEAKTWMNNIDPDFIDLYMSDDIDEVDIVGPEVWNLAEWNSYVIGL
ncbi:hypothetical protein [Lactobacillus phage Lbab1]|nr:hypothetical protein [Lactobacillus phage Lbab1]